MASPYIPLPHDSYDGPSSSNVVPSPSRTASDRSNGLSISMNGQVPDDERFPYRITTAEALRSGFARFNWFFATVIPFGMNVGIGFALLHKYDYAGLFSKPDTTNADPGAIFLDVILTTFFVAFFTTLLSPPGIRKAVSQAKISPINEDQLAQSPYRFFPLRVESTLIRSTLMGLIFVIFWGVFGILIATIACKDGKMALGNDTSTCAADITNYIFIKSAWAGIEGFLIYPLILLASLNKEHLSEEQYQQFVANIGLKQVLAH